MKPKHYWLWSAMTMFIDLGILGDSTPKVNYYNKCCNFDTLDLWGSRELGRDYHHYLPRSCCRFVKWNRRLWGSALVKYDSCSFKCWNPQRGEHCRREARGEQKHLLSLHLRDFYSIHEYLTEITSVEGAAGNMNAFRLCVKSCLCWLKRKE